MACKYITPAVIALAVAAATAGPEARVFRFPADRCVGKVMIQDAGLQREVKGFHYWIDGADWEYAGPAIGEVKIPEAKRVQLIVSEDGWKDTSFMSAFGPDDFHSLTLSGDWSAGQSKPMDSCMKHLAHLTGLRVINLRGSAVTTQGMMSLRGMTNLERIYLPAGATNSTVKLLHVFPNLKGLYFGETNIKDLGLTQFEGMDRLEELELAGKLLTNEGLKSLRHLRSVRYLIIGGPFSDEGFVHVQAMPALRTINVNTEHFGDAALQALSRAPVLEAIGAHWMKEITDRGVDHLAQMKNLKKLDIASAEITPRSIPTLARMTTLEELNLGGKPYTDAQIAPLSALKKLRSVWMGAGTNSKLTDQTLVMLRDLPLESLTISGEFTDEGVKIVGTMHRLTDLGLMIAPHMENKVTDRGIAHLSGLRNLEMLTLFNVRSCTLHGLSPLHLPKLRHLHITDIRQNDKGMDLSGMPAMEDLIISTLGHREGGKVVREPFTDDDIKDMANLKKLRRLQVPHEGITDRGLAHLTGLKNAEFINLGGDGITDEGLTAIAHLPKLDRLIIDGHITDAGLRHLESMPALSWLEIRSPHPISQIAIQQLRQKLPCMTIVRINSETR
ncbi:MAG: hypothetical protein IH624_13315 [Phycisphaerae bacterium]|nr:hypothetical protein [Phycisphaerae bacterium]